MAFTTLTNSWTKNLNQLLLENLEETELTNSTLANLMYMSERAFYQKVKETTGMTPNRYVRIIRLKRAKQLLQSGQYSQVKEVARRVGFIKTSYFSQLYEKAYGQRPSQIIN
jgi:transcriptional regulator GlxA family with amidase domain